MLSPEHSMLQRGIAC